MENIRESNSTNHSAIRVPSGYEVESGSFHLPSEQEGSMRAPAMRDRVSALKTRGIRKLHDARNQVRDRVASIKPMARNRVGVLRDGVARQLRAIEGEMRDHPAKWAGIAAGAGLGLGIAGRIMRHRASHGTKREFVLIESCC